MAVMTTVLRYLATFGLGVIACLAYFRLHPPPEKTPVTAEFSFDPPAVGGTFGQFGLKPGDILKSVNGITDQTMLKELLNGYSRGDVCLTFERQKQTHEICVKSKSTAGHG